jgi:hypothetical protein
MMQPSFLCMVPCAPGTGPGDPGYPCRDAEPPGPSAGDYACIPTDRSGWFDGTGAEGFCWAGRFGTGTDPLGAPCETPATCASPFGLAECFTWFDNPGFCTVRCSETLAEDGICGTGPAGDPAPGVCFASVCLDACDVPDGALGASGCASSGLACYATTTYIGYTWFAAGTTRPAGMCYPACTSDAWCAGAWGGGYRCDVASGVCRR